MSEMECEAVDLMPVGSINIWVLGRCLRDEIRCDSRVTIAGASGVRGVPLMHGDRVFQAPSSDSELPLVVSIQMTTLPCLPPKPTCVPAVPPRHPGAISDGRGSRDNGMAKEIAGELQKVPLTSAHRLRWA